MGLVMELYLHTGLSVRIIDELKSLAGDFGVEKIILFGSRARGDYKERSDIDVKEILCGSGGQDTRNIFYMGGLQGSGGSVSRSSI